MGMDRGWESDVDINFTSNHVKSVVGQVDGAKDLLHDLAIQIQMDKRCLFVLSNGLVGTGPPSIRKDDEVFLLQGVQVPMVLRRNRVLSEGIAETYTIVGAVLVHGLMNDDYISQGSVSHGSSIFDMAITIT